MAKNALDNCPAGNPLDAVMWDRAGRDTPAPPDGANLSKHAFPPNRCESTPLLADEALEVLEKARSVFEVRVLQRETARGHDVLVLFGETHCAGASGRSAAEELTIADEVLRHFRIRAIEGSFPENYLCGATAFGVILKARERAAKENGWVHVGAMGLAVLDECSSANVSEQRGRCVSASRNFHLEADHRPSLLEHMGTFNKAFGRPFCLLR
jgi:hypothetical protein